MIKLIENIPLLISSYYTAYPIESYSHKIESLYSFILSSIIPFSSFFIISGVLIIVCLTRKIATIHFKWLVILLIIVDLFTYWYSFNPMSRREFYTEKPKTAQFLLKDSSLYRIWSLIPRKYIDDSWLRDTQLTWKMRETMIGNIAMLYKIQSLHGYTAPLTFYRWDKFIAKLQKMPISQHPKLLSILNVKYIVIAGRINDKRLKLVGKYPHGVRIYRNKEILPRTFIVHNVKVVQNESWALNELIKKDFDPKQYAILEEEPIRKLSKSKLIDDKVKIVQYLPNQVIINAQLTSDGILVLLDSWYPGWKVYVDGKEDKIYKTNYLFRGVFLTKGRHQVKFVYDPITFKIGAWISIITLFTTILVLGIKCIFYPTNNHN
jgi:hypothetical protein